MKDKELVQSIEDQINAALQESQQSKKQKKTTKKESKKMDTPETPKKEPTIVATAEEVCDKEESTWQAKLAKLGKVGWIALLNSAGTKIATAVMSLNISILLVLTVVLTLVSRSFTVLVVGLLITLARYAVQEEGKKTNTKKGV